MSKKKSGRPPAGVRDGEMVKDYPQLSVRIPRETISILNAMSRVRARPQWRLVCDALECYLRAHPADEQRLIEELSKRFANS